MAVISFSKVELPFGWLGNMAPYPIMYEGQLWKTAEALFQALRYDDQEIKEKIRNEASPMGAKMKAKKFRDRYSIEPMSEADIGNMRQCLELKFGQHQELKEKLLNTGEDVIYEDIGTRRGGRHLFWGAYRTEEGVWHGTNRMGRLLMELRSTLHNAD